MPLFYRLRYLARILFVLIISSVSYANVEEAIKANDLATFIGLIDSGLSLDTRIDGKSLIEFAAKNKSFVIAEYLRKNGQSSSNIDWNALKSEFEAERDLCGTWVDMYEIVPGFSWGNLLNYKNEKNAHSNNPFQLVPAWKNLDCNRKICHYWVKKYNLDPRDPLRSLDKKYHESWKEFKCGLQTQTTREVTFRATFNDISDHPIALANRCGFELEEFRKNQKGDLPCLYSKDKLFGEQNLERWTNFNCERKVCYYLKVKYRVWPLYSWGNLPPIYWDFWKSHFCNENSIDLFNNSSEVAQSARVMPANYRGEQARCTTPAPGIAHIRSGLLLARSPEAAQKSFGWSVIQSSIRQMTSDNCEIPGDLADQIENQVFQEVSVDSLNTLKFLFANASTRRNQPLNAPLDLSTLEANPGRSVHTFIASILSYRFHSDRVGGRVEINPVNLLAKLAHDSPLDQNESQQVNQILGNTQLFRTRFLVSLLASRIAPVELSAFNEAAVAANIAECVAHPTHLPIDILIQRTCRSVLASLNQIFLDNNADKPDSFLQGRLRQLSLSLYINRTQSSENPKNTSLLVGQVATAFPTHNSTQISVTGRGSFSTLGAVVGHPSIALQMGIDPNTPCENGSSWREGMIYESANRNFTSEETDGVSCTGIGANHKTWGLTGSPATKGTIVSSFSLEPQQQVNWIAVRGAAGEIYSGCQPPGNASISSDAFIGPCQPQTQWTIVQPVLGRKVGMTHVSAPEVNITHSNSVFKGGIFTTPFKFAGTELFHFNDATVNQLNPSATLLLNLTERSPKNGLLKYVAAVQNALKPKAWLLPDSLESGIEDSAFKSLVRLDILSDLGKMDLSAQAAAFPTNSPWYAEAPWKERQEFLRFALPMIGYRIQSFYQEKLQRQLVLLGRSFLAVERVRQRLLAATQALDVLRDEDAMAILGLSADLTHIERPAAPLARDLLIAAVLGAKEAIRNEWVTLTEKMTNTCIAHYLIQGDFSQVLGPGTTKGLAIPKFLPECQDFFREIHLSHN